jgi:photosystem II stability/assembly factor-like uncharacterized protein
MYTNNLLLFCLLLSPFVLIAQRIDIVNSGTVTSIRGLSVVNDDVVWVSGSNGMVGRSVDGGKNWEWTTVKGFEKREFRDIEAFDENTALILAIADPGNILKTTDGGKSWKIVYEDSVKGIFLDAMSFSDDQNGIVVGDPIDGNFYLLTTPDQGATWKKIQGPKADSGEACFASSGTNIKLLANGNYLLVSGGLSSKLHTGSLVKRLPLLQGKESTGANSLAVSGRSGIIVGGDFTKDTSARDNCIRFRFNGKNEPMFTKPATPPHGYRSCVEYISAQKLITCGSSGVDISTDGGRNWRLISAESFHVCQKAKKGKAVFLAGSKGRIGKIED